MKVSSKNEAVELVFTSSKGTKIYTHKDLKEISAFRGITAEQNKRFASMCITKDSLIGLLDLAMEAVNKRQNFVEALSIIHELRWRANTICEENSLLELAYIYLMIEGEDLERLTPDYIKKKTVLVEAELDLKRFFLQEALRLVDNFSMKQGVDSLTYLEETKNLLLKMSRFTQSTS